jgi:hypothetical protein
MTWSWAWSFALVAVFATAARAQEGVGVQRVAVVRIDFGGNVPLAGQGLFARRLTEGLAAARFSVLSESALEQRLRAGRVTRCEDSYCFPELARAIGVGYLVTGLVSEQSKTYKIRLELWNGRTGASIGSVQEMCETCGIEDAGEKMNLAASALRARLEAVTRTPARFVIRSRPADAQAHIDGKVVGRTPLDIELPGGEHHLRLDLGGHDSLNRTFTVVSGVDETLDFDLVREPAMFPYRTVGWVAMGAATAAIVAGVWALAVDGNEIACAPAEKDAMNHCPLVRNTDVLGAVLLGAGTATAAIGGISLYLASRGGVSPEPSASRGLQLVLRGRF